MIVFDKARNIIERGDNVTYAGKIWVVDSIVCEGLRLSRFGVKTTVDPKQTVKYR